MICHNCLKPTKRKANKYCSNKCQSDFQFKQYIESWKANLNDGNKGKDFPQVSNHIKRYLIEKFENKCCLCGWNRLHPKTGKSPLEINHIDGNALNNDESNLELICPNCHSLTENFRNLNKGNGRKFRRK